MVETKADRRWKNTASYANDSPAKIPYDTKTIKRAQTPLQKPGIWLWAICLPLAFFGGIVAMLAIGIPKVTQNQGSIGYTGESFPKAICDHSGNFGLGLNAPSFWSPSQTFQITVTFGSFSFSMAKVVDVV